MIRPSVPSPSDVPVRRPVDAGGLGWVWARCGVPRETAVLWAEEFEPGVAQRLLAEFDATAFDLMEATFDRV